MYKDMYSPMCIPAGKVSSCCLAEKISIVTELPQNVTGVDTRFFLFQKLFRTVQLKKYISSKAQKNIVCFL